MQEDQVTKLLNFGLTVNQAKVYLSIIQSGMTSVNKISKYTQLHRQDIYKILPKLERMGLITKTLDTPFMIDAIPTETALYNLVSVLRQKSEKEMNQLELNMKELINEIKTQPNWEEEARLTLLTTDKAIKNKTELSFKNIKSNIDLIIDEELLNTRVMRYICEGLQTIAENEIKIRLIIEAPECENLVRTTIEKIGNNNKNYFMAKLIRKTTSKNYQIIDDKEAWITTQQKTESGFPCMLWTNDKNIINTYEEQFAKTWEDAKIITLTQNTLPMESLQLSS